MSNTVISGKRQEATLTEDKISGNRVMVKLPGPRDTKDNTE